MTTPPLALAAALAWALALRVPSHRQRVIAGTLAGLLVVNVFRPLMRQWEPLYVTAFLGWYAVTSWCVWTVLRKDEAPGPSNASAPGDAKLGAKGTPILLALAILASSVLAVRLGVTMPLSRAAFALALAAQVLAAVRFLSRGRWPDDAQRVALILVASSVVDATPGPWLLGMPARDWAVGRVIATATWLVIAGWEVRCLIRAHRSRA